jgi:hypothetical protein
MELPQTVGFERNRMRENPLAQSHLRLRISEVGKVFVQVIIELKEILVFDGIDQLEDPPGFCIRKHDLNGSFPATVMQDTCDRYPVLERISPAAGAGVENIPHMHILPRRIGDWNFVSVAGEIRVLLEELSTTYQRLKPHFINL